MEKGNLSFFDGYAMKVVLLFGFIKGFIVPKSIRLSFKKMSYCKYDNSCYLKSFASDIKTPSKQFKSCGLDVVSANSRVSV